MTSSPPISSSFVTPESPWLGLRSFSEDVQSFFFGRSAELDDLYERILDKPLTVLFGQSGLGKSSLLQAALVPRLRATGFLPVLIRFDHDAGAPPLELQLLECLRAALASAGNEQQAATLAAALADEKTALDCSAFLWLLFHDPAFGFIPSHGAPPEGFPRPVFLIDQFEEIFTLGERPVRRTVSAAFRESLAALVENRPPSELRAILEKNDELAERLDYRARHTRVLLSLREDFLHLLERWRRTMPSVMENRFELRMLSGPQAFQAVVRPGQLRTGLPAVIPDQVGRAIVRFVSGTTDDVPLEEIDAVPPLLSLVCAELNAQRLVDGETQITQAQFEGHSTDILASFYLRSFDVATYGSALEGISDAANALTTVRCLVEDRLLSADGFRESIAFDTIARDLAVAAAPDAAKAVLDELVHRRLLTVEERGGVRRIELAHDVLARIVKASRDERHEVEAVSRAKAEQERAEAETARILKERNRLQRLAILASCLAIIAAGGALVGWIGFQRARLMAIEAVKARNEALEQEKMAVVARNRSEESEKQAVAAKNRAYESEKQAVAATFQAQSGFESAFKGLSDLYDDYADGTLENTPGISTKQSNSLKSKLRGHLLEQLRKLNYEQRDHRGTIHFMARLLLDEGREAADDKDYTRAEERLTEALQWSQKRPLESASEAETYAGILLEAGWAVYERDPPESAKFSKTNLAKVRELAERWPDSWRLEYILIRLEFDVLYDERGNRESVAKLAEKLVSVIEKSRWHFDPVAAYAKMRQHAFWGDGNFERSAADYALERDLIVWFREHIAQRDTYTLSQLEIAAKWRFENILSFVETQFSQTNDATTVDERRAILAELETTMKALETRLPKSIVVYGARGTLLRLQGQGIAAGINTRSPDELRAAAERHRMVAAAMGVGSSVADLLASAFKSYTANDSDQPSKGSALEAIRNSLQDFNSLDLFGADTVLQNFDISESARTLPRADPAAEIHAQMVEHYLQAHSLASRDSKSALVGTFANISAAKLAAWQEAKDWAKIAEFWDQHYAGLPIKTLTSGDRSDLVAQLRLLATSLFMDGREADANQLWNDIFALCGAIISDRPWDFYVRQTMFGMCFDAGKLLADENDEAATQKWLRRGWSLLSEFTGDEIDLSTYATLPLKGVVPDDVPPNDAAFFARLKPNTPGGVGAFTRITILCDFSGVEFPFHVYIISGRNGYQRLLDQFRWLTDYRGGKLSKTVLEIFERLHTQADNARVDYREYCTREYPKAAVEAADRQLNAARALVSAQDRQTATPAEIARAEEELAAAYANACRSAIGCSCWEKLGEYASDWLASNPNNPSARSGLAIALFCQNRLAEAVSIYRESSSAPDRLEFKKAEAADFTALVPSESDARAASLKRLYLIAKENNVSFPDLVEYALGDELKLQRLMIAALEDVKKCENQYSEYKTKINARKLADAYNSAADRALYVKRWNDASNWARKSIVLDESIRSAYGNLATALLFQDQYEPALVIYKAHWHDRLNDATLGDSVIAQFAALEKAGIEHPNVARIKAALGVKPDASANGDDKPEPDKKP